ncbi:MULTISPECIES: ABC transporter ATP-binding protein [unclassified Aurantimonas]|uniref:ABC transporter ATP-binding protein n=1 Tax=unclassified Aurantimonas TaxID=2638230 RepID=UPI002E19C32E|nr:MULTISPECIES: ABC transporter ATP-binding protein [unclassified Aurantimonas]MEC5293401.1 ABC transporter ATP-binding protein [Aurantimonas sp. C2-3-R2]MEC5414476.1 ABC transporter ATP-binding protein [Aurantimonas sp. C2-4-R8]
MLTGLRQMTVTGGFGSSEGKGSIELHAITKRYGEERVVNSVDTRIEPGEFFSLLGPSGSGKTTTLMMLAGFADVDEGHILVDGIDIGGMPPQRRGFGMVFQNYAIFPHLSVFENVAFPLRARRLPSDQIRERVEWALELVRLERFADRFSRQLSGGQQQRVAIARAIVFHPSVVLMDEPLGALDKNLRYQVQVEIKEIQQRLGMTVVYVTHDQEEAMNMSDRIAIMNSGRIEQVGRPTEVYENPANIFTARFLGEANLIDGMVEEVRDGIAVLRTGGGLQLRARTSAGVVRGAQAALFVRPEKMVIGPEGSCVQSDGVNHVTGRLKRTSFLGNIHRHLVEINPGVEVTVDVQNSGGSLALGNNHAASVSWLVTDSLVLQS